MRFMYAILSLIELIIQLPQNDWNYCDIWAVVECVNAKLPQCLPM